MDPASEPAAPRNDGPKCCGRFAPETLLVAAILCLALAALVSFRLWDARVADYLRPGEKIASRNRWLIAVGELGRPLALAWLLLLWAWAARRPRLLLAGLLAMALAGGLVQVEKQFVRRIRPDETREKVMQKSFLHRSYSFPSGDAATAFAVAAVAAAFIATGRGRWIPFLLAALVGFTRLCLLRHYVSDVLGGAALGILCGYFALRLTHRRLSRAPPWWRLASGIAVVVFLIGENLYALLGPAQKYADHAPVTMHFLAALWPAVALVLLAAKGPAWWRWARRRARRRSSTL